MPTSSSPKSRCVDCLKVGITTPRKATPPGPRCATHKRAKRSDTRDKAWERRLLATYGITADEYWQIYKLQGGCCYICRRAKGTGRKRLSVDHCHKDGYIRGLLCGPCNRDVLGHLRDDYEALLRGVDYLNNPPAVLVLGERVAPIHYKE